MFCKRKLGKKSGERRKSAKMVLKKIRGRRFGQTNYAFRSHFFYSFSPPNFLLSP